MIDDGKIQEVKDILNQRSIVVRDGKQLKAIDFVDAFPEFKEVAKELVKHFKGAEVAATAKSLENYKKRAQKEFLAISFLIKLSIYTS